MTSRGGGGAGADVFERSQSVEGDTYVHRTDQRRCVKAYMSHDIPSRARAIIAFLGVETGYGARFKALACTFIGVGGVRPRD